MKQNKIKFDVCNLPLKSFLPFCAMILIAAYCGFLPTAKLADGLVASTYPGTLAFLMAIGGLFFWLGNTIPIVNDYMGGACLLPLFGMAAMNQFGLIPMEIVAGTKVLMSGGFQDCFIGLLLVGSVLVMDRKIILNATARYIPTVIGSQVFAIGFAMLAGWITGFGPINGLFDVAAPCMSGGSAGAIATLPKLYTDLSGTDMMGEAGKFLCYASIANVLAIALAAVLGGITKNNHTFNGAGQIMRKGVQEDLSAEKRPSSSPDYKALASGLFMAFTLYTFGNVLGSLPILKTIPAIAWTIILCIIIKCTAILPTEFENNCVFGMSFALRAMLPVELAGVALNSFKITTMAEFFTPQAFIVILVAVLGAFIGAFLFGHITGLFGYEAGVTAGLCCCNIGGTGDVAVLTAANRMNLLAFASISTRIGGALMVIWLSILYPILH